MDIKTVFSDMNKYFRTNITKSLWFREEQLKKLKNGVLKYEKEIIAALHKDLGKAPQESYMTEIGIVLDELKYARRHLSSWVRPKRKLTPLGNYPGHSYVFQEPYGTVLIISPWNYPFQLTMTPLIGAIAAGNCCIIKPSEFSPHVSAIIEKMLAEVFDPQYVAVVQGAVEESQALLGEPFDYIFFTGNPAVGQIVMEAAAKHLTPVTLELGGKSPCIVHESANISMAAKRIVFGKFLNSGQTCVAPDYVLVDQSCEVELLHNLKKYIKEFFGENPLENQDYPHIITDHHYQRLMSLLDGEEIVIGGRGDSRTKKIEPTVLSNISWDAPVMAEEIFGPILPVISYDFLENAVFEIEKRPKPLAFYFFAKDTIAANELIHTVSFGGGCINDTVVHLLSPRMPFGGVGKSGMGNYHGKYSFQTFSHQKSVIKRRSFPDIPLRYHPYSKTKLKWIRRFLG